jgi:hypothetical protein
MSKNSGIMTLTDFQIESMTAETMSALDTHNNIITAEHTIAEALISLCENLKKMRDEQLYKSLGFEKFEDYTENACNMKKRQAYNYIQTYERLGNSFLQSNAQLGITKLQLLTEICAFDREEFVEENDLEGMSVAEIKKLVEEHQQRGEQLDLLTSKCSDAEQDLEDKDKLIAKLQAENKELRNRPVEVVVQEPSQTDIDKAVAVRTEALKAEFENEKKKLEAQSKDKIKEAQKKATAKAEKERQKIIDEETAKIQADIENKYKEKIASAEAEKAEALKKAEEIARTLDKNANKDIVTASLHFTEAQKQLESFVRATKKIALSDEGNATRLKILAANNLKAFIKQLHS